MTKTAEVLNAAEQVVTMDRRQTERRDGNCENTNTADEPRRKKQRRRQIDPTT